MNILNYEPNQKTFSVYIAIEAYFNRNRRVFLRKMDNKVKLIGAVVFAFNADQKYEF